MPGWIRLQLEGTTAPGLYAGVEIHRGRFVLAEGNETGVFDVMGASRVTFFPSSVNFQTQWGGQQLGGLVTLCAIADASDVELTTFGLTSNGWGPFVTWTIADGMRNEGDLSSGSLTLTGLPTA